MTSWGRRDFIEQLRASAGEGRRRARGLGPQRVPGPDRRRPRRAARRGSRLPESFLLYPAQTWPHKNHERLLEALARVRDRERGDRSRSSARAGRRSHYRRVRERSDELGLAKTTSLPGLRQPARAPRPLRARRRGWSSRAGSRAGGCRSARHSTPACRSPHPPRPGCPTSSATPDCSSTRTTPRRSPTPAASALERRGRSGRTFASAGRRARPQVQLRPHREAVPRPLPASRTGPLTEEDRILLASPPPA